MPMVTVIGRGHSGTRAISHTLYASGVYMGSCLNPSGDLIPPEDMYEACRVLARYVRWQGGLEWNWDDVLSMDIPDEFIGLINSFLSSVLKSPVEYRGWKIPETTLAFPWIVRMFPEIKYIFWIRNPRDCIIGRHITDDLGRFGIQYPATEDERLRRAISWKYQYDLVKAVPKPENWLEVRFEDFVLRQEETLVRLEDYLGIKLARVVVQPEAVDRWRRDEGVNYFDFFAPAMKEYGYEIAENGK
ncbi:MAG: sulfotransferase family protein [Anaerolineae bacterium]